MKKFFPVKIVETRWATVAIEGESMKEVREKCESIREAREKCKAGPDVFLDQRYESSVLVVSAGTNGTFEEMGEYACYDKRLRRVTKEDVFRSEEHGELYFHAHVEGEEDCKKCALHRSEGGGECRLAPCSRCERQDDRSGCFSKE